MAALGIPPWVVRSEFVENATWGPLSSKLRRYEIAIPATPGPSLNISDVIGCVHAGRSSLMVRIGGGHLKAPTSELLRRLVDEAPARLKVPSIGPAEYTRLIVSWLEREQRSGYLERSYTTATLLVAISDVELWTWLVCPHGLVHGSAKRIVFGSTDLRYPVLRRLGAMAEPAFKFPGTEVADQATSICCIGTRDGYEMIRTRLGSDEVVIALDRSTLPFGPWPERPISLDAFWQMEAAWKYGLSGTAVAIGCLQAQDLAVPEGWQVNPVPLTP